MKRLAFVFVSLSLLLFTGQVYGQKKPLDHSVYDGWQHIAATQLTPDGKTIIYEIAPQEGDSELVIMNLDDKSSITIPRGNGARLSYDGKWAFCKISAPFAETRKARIDKKKEDQMPQDSLAIINVAGKVVDTLPKVKSWKLASKGNIIAYESNAEKPVAADTTTAAKAAEDSTKADKAKKPETERVLVVKDLDSGHCDTLRNFDKYVFDRDGSRLAVTFKKDKKDSLSRNEAVLFTLPGMKRHVIDSDKKFYGDPTFNANGDKLVMIASTDSNDTGSKHCSIILTEEIVRGKGRKAVRSTENRIVVPQDYRGNLPEGWGITENARPYFSASSDRLLLGISEIMPPKDTTLVEFEKAGLDIWNWDIYMTPPIQKSSLPRLRTATRRAVIDLKAETAEVIPVTETTEERFMIAAGSDSDIAYVTDKGPYMISSTWDSNSLNDFYVVNMKDGSRELMYKSFNGSPSLSPEGKWLTWYDNQNRCWFSQNTASGKVTNLTADLDGIFYDDEDDHPAPKPGLDRPHWFEGDEAFLMVDKYDVWYIRPDGSKSICLTGHEGRTNDIQYRITGLKPSKLTSEDRQSGIQEGIKRGETIYLTTYDRKTKENGFASILADKAGIIRSFTVPYSFAGAAMARDASTIAYTKGDVHNSRDQYVTNDFWQTEEKLSSINPQQAEYNWCDVQLVHWTAYDGTKLDGLLYTPENLDKSRKYPMMVYFYEKNSQGLYSYVQPAPSRSVINYSFYASRGYVVFIPDIVYKDGHPGESAYNCICSGAEEMCRQFPFIDKDKMAIQGQSWGGYQVAYLVTRTNMFAAAGAGAPVGNMTSAYGGIRWESGMVRAMQYEHGQSRIGKSLWDEGGLDLYIENSPVFHTQNVTTPVLIMHNDNDGAVPWYQGIEFFMALRRFHHPAWLLEYNNEAHNLVQRRNTRDLSIRLQQFFDHYLKGDKMPAWMKTGVPQTRKGEYYGLELVDE